MEPDTGVVGRGETLPRRTNVNAVPTLTLYKIVSEMQDPTSLVRKLIPRVTYGWRLKGANGEKLSRHSQGGGFKTARSAWRNFLLTVAVGGRKLPTDVPRKGTNDLLCEHKSHGKILFKSDVDTTIVAHARRHYVPFLRVRRPS